MINITEEQQTIINAARANNANICINALAGTGKTTLLEHISRELIKEGAEPKDILMLAFGTRNKKDFDERMPDGIQAATFNSIGFKAWMRARNVGYFKVWKNKTYAVMRAHGINQERFPDLPKAVSLAKNYCYVPPECNIKHSGNTSDALIYSLLYEFDLDYGNLDALEALDIVKAILLTEIYWSLGFPDSEKRIPKGWKKGIPYINYDDQIYMSVFFGGLFDKYPYVFVDEAQDLSLFQHALIEKVMHKQSRFIMVGDPNQAIYGFRGAFHASFEKLKSTHNCVEYPITINFRCSVSVIEEAKKIQPTLQARKDAPIGQVQTQKTLDLSKMKAGDAMLCRYNAPLVAAFFELVALQKPATILGRDIGAGLIRIVERNIGHNSGREEMEEEIKAWKNTEIAKAQQKGQTSRVGNIEDQAGVLSVILDQTNNPSKEKLLKILDNIFSSDTAPITLSSIHKAKGFEWDTVYILDPHLMPSKYAKLDWELIQEKNLRYVAITRAKWDLVYTKSER